MTAGSPPMRNIRLGLATPAPRKTIPRPLIPPAPPYCVCIEQPVAAFDELAVGGWQEFAFASLENAAAECGHYSHGVRLMNVPQFADRLRTPPGIISVASQMLPL